MTSSFRRALLALWGTHRTLTAVGLAAVVALIGCAIGLATDPRTVTGAPVWLKPGKFAASIALYSLTLAWVLGSIGAAHAARARRAGNVVAWTLAGEYVIIALQAARGRASHFNAATVADGALFTSMGIMIAALWLASVVITVAAFRTRYASPVLGEAIRWGLAISVVGAALGGLMTRPTPAQLEQLRAGGRPPVVGAHTVGAPDGGPGVTGVGWSTEHGDLRVAHFVGLHALQALPLFALWLGRRRRPVAPDVGVKLVRIAGVAWASAAAVLAIEALRGVSVLAADLPTLAALGAVAMAAGIAAAVVTRRPAPALKTSVR